MRTSMMNPIDYLFRWRSVVALLGGILVATVMILAVSIQQTAAQTTVVEPGQHFIAAGDYFSLAVKGSAGGTVYSWGGNGDGQLGLGDTKNRHTPVQITSLTGIKDLGAGQYRSLALKNDGTVWAWGENYDGQLGTGYTFADAPVKNPKQVFQELPGWPGGRLLALTGITNVDDGRAHSLALSNADNTLWAWGYNYYGQLATDPDNGTSWAYPVWPVDQTQANPRIPTGVRIVDVAGGGNHTLALMSDGTVYSWGGNSHGQLGLGDIKYRHVPVKVEGLSDVKAVAAGAHHSLAVTNDGHVFAWGGNAYCQVGNPDATGNCSDQHTPVQVRGLTGGAKDVTAGEHHSLALMNDETVYGWGANIHGQLGTGGSWPPERVKGPGGTGTLTGITEVEAGAFFSLALKNDGTVWAWGGNSYGQLGDGSTHDRSYPVWTGLTGMGPSAASTPPGAVPGEKTAICHKAETPAEKTLIVPNKALKGHLRHGDTLGPCE